MSLRKALAEIDPEILLADGFDKAFIGTATRCGQPTLAVYSRRKCIEVLMKDMSEDQAEQYFDFNVVGAWVGERTPIFLEELEVQETAPGDLCTRECFTQFCDRCREHKGTHVCSKCKAMFCDFCSASEDDDRHLCGDCAEG